MDFLSPLEQKLISSYKSEMISFLDSHPEYFEEAINLSFSDKQPFAWRAAWLLCSCMEINDKRIKKSIKDIIDAVPEKKDGHQTGLLKILLQMDLEDEFEGIVFNISLDIWEQINKIASVRLTALRLLIKIAKKHPDLINEISFLTQDHYLGNLSPAVKKCVSKMMKGFNFKLS